MTARCLVVKELNLKKRLKVFAQYLNIHRLEKKNANWTTDVRSFMSFVALLDSFRLDDKQKISVGLHSFPKSGADAERWPSRDGDSFPSGGCWLCSGQSVLLRVQRPQGSLPEHQGPQGTLPVEPRCWYLFCPVSFVFVLNALFAFC